MIVSTMPPIWAAPVQLVGTVEQQLESARRACVLAISRRCRAVTVTTSDGRSVGGPPLHMIGALHPDLWPGAIE